MIHTEYIDSMCADNVLRELHINAMTYHNQWSLVGCNNCTDVWSCDPATFRRYHSATCCISNMSPSYKPLDLCRWVAVGCCTREGHRIAYSSFCRTWDANLSWSNCVSTRRKMFFNKSTAAATNVQACLWFGNYRQKGERKQKMDFILLKLWVQKIWYGDRT
jgi:hypothetical protein